MFHTLLAPGALDGDTTEIIGSGTANITIASSKTDFNLWNFIESVGSTGFATYNVTIGSGATLGASSTSTYGFDTGTGWPSNATLNLTNNGTITGAGGNGGVYNSGNGQNGGDAMIFRIDAYILNNGIIQSGGGGGGSGSQTQTVQTGEEQESQP